MTASKPEAGTFLQCHSGSQLSLCASVKPDKVPKLRRGMCCARARARTRAYCRARWSSCSRCGALKHLMQHDIVCMTYCFCKSTPSLFCSALLLHPGVAGGN